MSVIEREQQQVQVDPVREERARVLEAAALEIEVRGWTQCFLEDEEGRVCAIGALAAVCSDKRFPSNPYTRAVVSFGESGRILAGWNDTYGRTAGEVTFVLRWRAAEIRDGR